MSELTIQDLKYILDQAIRDGAEDSTPVHFSYNYGDHWRTQVAPSANDAELMYVEYSSYHNMDKLTEEDDEEDGQKESGRRVLVIT